MQQVWKESRLLFRRLARQGGLSFTVIALIAAGIGLATALFSVAQATILAPLPAKDADRLVALTSVFEGQPRQRMSPLEARLHAERGGAFERFGVWMENLALARTGAGPAENLRVGFADSGFFRTLGVPPLAGRAFEPREDRGEDTHPVAILSHGLWRGAFGADPDAVGGHIELAQRTYRIVGVLPRNFPFEGADVWLPATMSGSFLGVGVTDGDTSSLWLRGYWAVGRLKADMTIAAASEKAAEVAAKLREAHPQSQRQRDVRLEPLRDLLYGRVTGPLEVLLLGAGLLLLICVVNVAALLLLRAHSRQREMALRLALGASRRRIAGTLMAESLVLTGLGGLVGIVLAGALTRLAVGAFDLGLPSFTEIALVPEVLTASVGLVLLTGFITGLVPALRLAGVRPRAVLGSGVRDTAPIESRRQRGVLVAAEVAIAVVLLVGAGLTARSLHRFVNTDLGYVTENVVSARLNAKVPPYQMPAVAGSGQSDKAIFGRWERRGQLLEGIATRLAAVPEVGGVAFLGGYMLGEADKDTIASVVPEPQDPQVGENWRAAQSVRVGPGTLGQLGFKILRGREFTPADRVGTPLVAVVSERVADRFWPGEDPIGKRFHTWWGSDESGANITRVWTVVGLAAEALHRGRRDPRGEGEHFVGDIYRPFYQTTSTVISILVRTRARPEPVAEALRRVVAEVDPNVAVHDVRTMSERLRRREAVPRFAASSMGLFAGLAALLAFVGTYGVLAFSVRQRTSEIAVRSALGARAREILALVYRQGMVPVAVGVVAGLAVAWQLSRWLEALLFEVERTDPATYMVTTLFVLVAASLACLVPAWRASRVDPSGALRYE